MQVAATHQITVSAEKLAEFTVLIKENDFIDDASLEYLLTFRTPDWKRGDVIIFDADGYRNDGKCLFDGSKLVNLENDGYYGVIPSEFAIGEEFHALYWYGNIYRGEYVYFQCDKRSAMELNEFIADYDDDSEEEVKTKIFEIYGKRWLVVMNEKVDKFKKTSNGKWINSCNGFVSDDLVDVVEIPDDIPRERVIVLAQDCRLDSDSDSDSDFRLD